MMIVMTPHATPEQIDSVLEHIKTEGFQPHRSDGKEQTVIGVVGIVDRDVDPRQFEVLDGVAKVVRISSPFKLASRQFKEEDTIVDVGEGVKIGGREVVLMAGPCTIETKEQVEAIAPIVAAAGAQIMRGGAFKPRTSPYTFQGMGEEGLQLLRDAADRHDLLHRHRGDGPLADRDDAALRRHPPGRRAQHAELRPAARSSARCSKPVLLKRGIAATIEELLLSAEYILAGGNKQVILCERGIRTFETSTRNTLDISAIPVVKKLSHLPIVVDPSHAHGPARHGRADGARGGRGRRRRADHRGAQRSGARAVRRRAVAVAGAVHRAEHADPRHRAVDRPQLSAGGVEQRAAPPGRTRSSRCATTPSRRVRSSAPRT